MPNININRRHLEEAQRRRALRERAGSLAGRRSQFIRYMEDNGFSSEAREAELKGYEELVERLEEQAEYEAVDGL